MFGDLLNQAKQMLGSADAGDVQDAAQDHVDATDPQDLATQVRDSLPQLGQGGIAQLAQSLLGSLSSRGHDPSDVADAAGTSADAAQSGDGDAVATLVDHVAGQHPEALKDAVMQFVGQNPQLVERFAPSFLQGIVGRMGGG